MQHVHEMPFCPNLPVSQLLIKSLILKHEDTRNGLLVLYILNVLF